MPKDLPEDWINGKLMSLKVSDLVRNAPERLYIFKTKTSYRKTEGLQCRWLPVPESIDIRPNAGRNSSGKRLPYKASTGFDDPYKAAKAAVRWHQELQEDIDRQKQNKEYNSNHSLHIYWEKWFAKFKQTDASPRNRRDRLNQWNGKGWGLAEQKWSHKSIDEIDALDIEEYFALLDKRGSGKKGSMYNQKANQKTLLNKLNKEARKDFPKLQPFVFPVITKYKEEVEHFTKEEWQQIIEKVIELSGGKAQKSFSENQYQKLDWGMGVDYREKNWVDFYDCLMLNWFFYLRPKDIPILKSEWFQDKGNGQVRLFLEEIKQGRTKKYETAHYRPDGYKFWKRMNMRRPKGYLAFPFYQRTLGSENDSNVKEVLNKMIKKVVELCHIKKRKKVVWGMVRHTAFRLTLQDDPELGRPPDIFTFASNGHTSQKMLMENYLLAIDRENVALRTQKKIKPSTYSLIKRVSLDE